MSVSRFMIAVILLFTNSFSTAFRSTSFSRFAIQSSLHAVKPGTSTKIRVKLLADVKGTGKWVDMMIVILLFSFYLSLRSLTAVESSLIVISKIAISMISLINENLNIMSCVWLVRNDFIIGNSFHNHLSIIVTKYLAHIFFI
jgi:hypothetical protein